MCLLALRAGQQPPSHAASARTKPGFQVRMRMPDCCMCDSFTLPLPLMLCHAAELPEDPSWVRQAEDRAHRKGQVGPPGGRPVQYA